MTNLQEVPTDELLSFQDFPSVHTISGDNTTIPISQAHININEVQGNLNTIQNQQGAGDAPNTEETNPNDEKAFWTLNYYQKFFDVDTSDVVERIMASITPKWDNSLKHHLRSKPDLYGPFWISITLIFTIAISGNIADYFQHHNSVYHWKYDFHMVSIAATIIFLYVTLIPFVLWGLLKWSVHVQDIEGMEEDLIPGILELICVYGYSLFIYIPVAILWSIQINMLQWGLTLFGTFISGSVLLLTLMPALRFSRHKIVLSITIVSFHLLLAAGTMLCFFHASSTAATIPSQPATSQAVVNANVTNN